MMPLTCHLICHLTCRRIHHPFRPPRLAARRRSPERQRGAVLALTLMLLVILTLLGSFAIRNATQGERVMNGLRTNAVAQQSAETALRFCEQLAISANDGQGYKYDATHTDHQKGKVIKTAVSSPDQGLWKEFANWKGDNVITVPEAYFKSANSAASNIKAANAPLCLVQDFLTENARLAGYLVTARGFANDTILDSDKKVTSGAEVWLQSILLPDPDS